MLLAVGILLCFTLAAIAPWLHRRAGRWTGWWLALWPLILFMSLLVSLADIIRGGERLWTLPWVSSLGLEMSLRLDGLGMLFALIITGIGVPVFAYAGSYLKGHPLLGRFYMFLLLFLGAMLGLVLADDLVFMFVFWELTSLVSYLLIGFDHERESSRAAARQALLVTGGGGLALLAGILLLGQTGGTFSAAGLVELAPLIRAHSLYLPILLLVLLGVATKSAQVPFHFWLPSAMAAPTPVSAYLHSATMVNAGIYLLARLHPVLGHTPEWHYLVMGAGLITMVTGGIMALPQTDLKRLLAWSTVSALGIMVLLLGIGTTLATKAALVFLLVHSMYKGALFMVAGTVDHEVGTRDVRSLTGLIRVMPVTAAAAGLAALSMSGFPPLLGFIGKELMVEAKIQAPAAGWFTLVAGVLGNMTNVAVAVMVGVRPFVGRRGSPFRTPHRTPVALAAGAAVLGGASLAAGLFPDLIVRPLLAAAVSAVRAEPTAVHLALWHGLNPVLLLSVATMAGGGILFGFRRVIRRLAERLGGMARLGPARIYEQALAGMIALAGWQTRRLQHGRLGGYLATVVAVTVMAGVVAWVGTGGGWPLPEWTGVRFYEVAAALLILGSGWAAVRSRSRLAAVVALSAVGFGIALVFVLYGAPDLAVTQILVETLTVLLFVFIFFRLRDFNDYSGPRRRIRDALLATVAGGGVTLLLLAVLQQAGPRPLAEFFARTSLGEAHGRNVVNVILVDFRALDTLGEITVLAAAALGVWALFRLRREEEP